MNTDAVEKITMLKNSSQCLVCGLLGLLPGIGLPFAILAFWHGGKARNREKKYWNAAKSYRTWGTVAASVGTIIWILTAAVIALNASNVFSDQF
jgi:hypothetical protein